MGPGTGGLPSAFFRPAPKSGAAAAARVPGRPAPPWASAGGPGPGLRGRRGTRTAGTAGGGGGLGSTTGVDMGGGQHLRRGSAPEPEGGGHGAEETRPHAADAGCTRHVRRRAES